MESASSEVRRVTSMIRTRPARSVTNRRPSGANAIDHGISRFVTTGSTANRTPSEVVNTSPGGVVGGGAGGAGVPGVGGSSQARVWETWTASVKARTLASRPYGMTAILRCLYRSSFAFCDVDAGEHRRAHDEEHDDREDGGAAGSEEGDGRRKQRRPED